MAARLPADLLDRPAEESSRLLALKYLDDLARAQRRLQEPRDPEALHDFRVGLRHLRSCLRAYRIQLKSSVTGKTRRRLRKLMRATNAGRDTEVQLAWLGKQDQWLEAEDIQGLFWLIGRLDGRKSEILDPATARLGQGFGKVATKLRRRLATLQIEIVPGPGKPQPTFGQVTGELIQRQAARLRADLTRVRGAADIDEAHQARIAVKRLRYLLEPVVRKNARARALIKRLKEAQDLLGDLHDMHVLSQEIATSLAASPAGHPEHVPPSEHGLRTLQRLASEQGVAALENLHHRWSGQRATLLLSRADEIGKCLREITPDRREVTAGVPNDVASLDSTSTRRSELAASPGRADAERVV